MPDVQLNKDFVEIRDKLQRITYILKDKSISTPAYILIVDEYIKFFNALTRAHGRSLVDNNDDS